MFGTWFKKFDGKCPSVSAKPLFLVWLVCLVFMGGAGIFSGCTSDNPSAVGTGLIDGHLDGVFDAVLETLVLRDIELYNGTIISQENLPLGEQEVLYLGAQEGTESSILLNYDFSDVFTESFPESAWTADNITSVKLRFLMLKYYGSLQTPEKGGKSDKALAKYYEVRELDEAFDPVDFPGTVDGVGEIPINSNDGDLVDAEYLELPIREEYFLNWVAEATTQGLVVSERVEDDSNSGLVGFSSRNMLHPASSLIDYQEDTLVAPIIIVHFDHNDSNYLIEPYADISSFHVVSEAPADPADGLILRTCLRNYPMLRFDFSSLPPNIFINRAVLSVTNDTTTSFGALQAIVVSEINTDQFVSPGDTLPLADLSAEAYPTTGMINLQSDLNYTLEFNVTTAVQRFVNGVYEPEVRGFVLTAGEDFFPTYDADAVDPDFYFTQFNFFGTGTAGDLGPKLKIAYTQIDSLERGGE